MTNPLDKLMLASQVSREVEVRLPEDPDVTYTKDEVALLCHYAANLGISSAALDLSASTLGYQVKALAQKTDTEYIPEHPIHYLRERSLTQEGEI